MNKTTRTLVPCHSPMLFSKAERIAGTGDGVICVILCAATIEAFVNDLTEWYMYSANHNSQCESLAFHRNPAKEREEEKSDLFRKPITHCVSFSHFLLKTEEDIALRMRALETARASLARKIAELYGLLAGRKWETETQLHQDFSLMTDIRNGAVHMKGSTLVSAIRNGEQVSSLKYEGHPDFIGHLFRREIIGDKPTVSTWMDLIEGAKFCEWTLDVTSKTIQEIVEVLPDAPISNRFRANARF